MPAPAFGESRGGSRKSGRHVTRGKFLGSARWLATPGIDDGIREGIQPYRPRMHPYAENESVTTGADSVDSPIELAPLLDAITEEVQRFAATVRDGIMADFAARVAATRGLSPDARRVVLRALAEQRRAALDFVKRSATLEMTARKKAALTRQGRRKGAAKSGGQNRTPGPSGPKR